MSAIPTLLERNKEYYALNFGSNLPPGTDTVDQLDNNQRPVPEWPPEQERKGKWISAYLDTLDPETEYDQIIKTANFFSGNTFAVAIGYCSTFVMLTQPPGGAAAINFGARAFKRPHRRFYETADQLLDWMWYGSASEETKRGIEAVNRLHKTIWKNTPGAFSNPPEGQMSVIGSAVFETYLRKLVGAKNQKPYPHVAAATWDELEGFYRWFQDLPFDEWTNPEDREKGHAIADAFVNQFSTLWFPKHLHWVGRQMLLTVLAPKVREQQDIGHPNPVLEHPVKPMLFEEYQAVKKWGWGQIDADVTRKWERKEQRPMPRSTTTMAEDSTPQRQFMSFTKTYHHKPYDLISPSRPELSAAGKNVVITGGGTGIGKSIALSFAKAGASSVSILGRRLDRLEIAVAEIRSAAKPGTRVLCKKADLSICDEARVAIDEISLVVGKAHIFVSNAGFFPKVGGVVHQAAEDYLEGFKLNVITTLHALQAFVPHAAEGAIVLNISTSLAHIKPWAGLSGYCVTKAANLKLVDFFATENTDIHVVNVQPGVIETELSPQGTTFNTTDDPALPGHFCVWLASPEARFLKNKFVWANWDVQELMQRAGEIESSHLLTWIIDGVRI
ncbi:reductase [Colletotrichum asianum]|uniref:Reductase n=1 Tax=Colletotrichum asianum TaxID=702518 RepID=A0A8H3WIS9_9PEZI|nr:reductase [Colletotrichum asianum]